MISRDEIRAVLVQRGFATDGLTQEHAESLALPGRETVKIKRFNSFPLVIHPRHEGIWNDLLAISGVIASPDKLAHNSNFVGFDKRLHGGKSPIAYGFDFGFDSPAALHKFLDMLLGEAHVNKSVFDPDALAFFDGFMAPDNPQFVFWLPNYVKTLSLVRHALARNAPGALFETIWKSRDNAVSNAGQGVMGFLTADRMHAELVEVIRDIAGDGSPENFDAMVARLERWRSEDRLPSVPRLLLARAFSAIHPERYHTTVDAAKQELIIPWFAKHTGFVSPNGNWAQKAEALSAHLGRANVFGDDLERRNMFPWYVFEQMRDVGGTLPFRPGHTSRRAAGEAHGSPESRTIEYRHNVIQDRLFALLCERHGENAVGTERPTGTGGRADALVCRPDGRYELYEIKPAASAADAVRQAMGQLLEYGYRRGGLDPIALHVVSDAAMDDVTLEYLQSLEVRFGLKLDYMQVSSSRDTGVSA